MNKKSPVSRLLVKIASELGYVEVMPGVQRTNEEKEAWAAERHDELRLLKSHLDVAEYISGGSERKDSRTLEVTFVKSTRFKGIPKAQAKRADSLTAWAAIKEWNRIQDWVEGGYMLLADYESDYIYRLDANAQGIQIMAALVGNLQTAQAVNILHVEGNPSDPYGLIGKAACSTDIKGAPSGDYADTVSRKMALGEVWNEIHYSKIPKQYRQQAMQRMHDLIVLGGRGLSKGPLMTAAYGASKKTITYGEKGLRNAILKLENGKFKDCDPEILCAIFMTVMEQLFPALKQFTDLIQEAIDTRLTNQFGPADVYTGQRSGRGDIMNLLDGGRQRWVQPAHLVADYWVYAWSEGVGEEKVTHVMNLVLTEKDGIPHWMDTDTGKFYQKEFTHEDLVVRWMTPNGAQWEHSYYLEEQDIIRCKEGITADGKKSELTCRKVPGEETLDVTQMMSAMSPNIIHSLDACMLSMVTNEMAKHGAKMVAVHDEYGTHLADANLMESLIPKMFVKMLEGDVLQDILDDIHLEWEAPKHGVIRQFDISECLEANYMFS